MELDPRYASVIVERFHLAYPAGKITALRDGQEFSYNDIAGHAEAVE